MVGRVFIFILLLTSCGLLRDAKVEEFTVVGDVIEKNYVGDPHRVSIKGAAQGYYYTLHDGNYHWAFSFKDCMDEDDRVFTVLGPPIIWSGTTVDGTKATVYTLRKLKILE